MAGLLLLLVCFVAGTLAPRRPPAALTVLTWNMYVGTDVDAALAAVLSPDTSDDGPALAAALRILRETDVTARADAIAREVARSRPHVIGLEEVSRIRAAAALTGGAPVELDFLEIAEHALAARGLHYRLAAEGPGVDISLPGVRLADRDVLLVDADRVRVISAAGRAYTRNLGAVAPGVRLVRGWAQARLEAGGAEYTVADTHAESDQGATSLDPVRVDQLRELAAALAARPRVVIIGDLNSRPGPPAYRVLTAAGYTDAWRALRPAAPGGTCCNPPDLANATTAFTQRIDYVFTRGLGRAGVLRGTIERLGVAPAERAAGPAHPIWPSDHAGLLATLHASARPGS